MLDQLLGKARQVDYALHRNELSTTNDALSSLATATLAERSFSVDPFDLRRVGGRVAAVLQLQRRQTITAREIEMGVNNMRNRLSTLTTAITQLTEASPPLSRRASGSSSNIQPSVANVSYSEQLEKLVAEAHSESRALRDVFTLFYPQLVAELIARLDSYGYRQLREREEIAGRLRVLESTSAAVEVSKVGRPSGISLPPPVPRRPSLSFEDKEKRGMGSALIQSQSPMAVVDDDDGVAVITVTDDAAAAEHLDGLTLRDRLAREEQAAMARAGHERRNSNPLEIHAIALETPGHTQHWWKEAPAVGGSEADKREEDDGGSEQASEERLQVVEYSYGDDDDSDGSPTSQATVSSSSSATPSAVSVYPLVSPTKPSLPPLDSRYPIATVPGTTVPVLTKLSPTHSPTASFSSSAAQSSQVFQQPPPPPPRPQLGAVPPPLPAGYLPPSSQRAGGSPSVTATPPPLPLSASAPSLPSLTSAEAAGGGGSNNAVDINATRPSSRRRMPNNSIDISATPQFATTLASLLPPRAAASSVASVPTASASASSSFRDDLSPTSAGSAPASSPSPSLSPPSPQPRSIIKKGGGARRRSTSGQRVSFNEVVEERSVGGGREERAGGVGPTGPAAATGSRRESYEYNNRLGDEWLDRKELRLSNGDGVFYAHSPRYI